VYLPKKRSCIFNINASSNPQTIGVTNIKFTRP
ncbi:hypothetical protein MGSAQ_001522, partial [marine sediment metagenome]